MNRTADLRTAVADVHSKLRAVARLADVLQEVRYDMPPGSPVRPDRDGVSRPVEALLAEREARGVDAEIELALDSLRDALVALDLAERALCGGISAWEGRPA